MGVASRRRVGRKPKIEFLDFDYSLVPYADRGPTVFPIPQPRSCGLRRRRAATPRRQMYCGGGGGGGGGDDNAYSRRASYRGVYSDARQRRLASGG